MKKFTVQVEQIRRGYVTIEADNMEDALKLADVQFNHDGEELPEMDDCNALHFTVVQAVCEFCLNYYSPEKVLGAKICFNCMTQIQKFAKQ
jgi:hypothetical protein